MNINFDKNNQITIVDKEGKIIFQQDKYNLDDESLRSLGISDYELNKIKQMLEKRKYSFY
jgi:hypothetical protein